MKQEGIDSINFESGHKVGGMPKVQLFDISRDIAVDSKGFPILDANGKYTYTNGTKATLNILSFLFFFFCNVNYSFTIVISAFSTCSMWS